MYANDAAVRLLRLTAEERVGGAAGRDLMVRFDVYDEHGEPVVLEQLPGARVRAGEVDPEPMLVRNVVKATGEERWLLNKTTTIRDVDGAVTGIVNVIEDVTRPSAPSSRSGCWRRRATYWRPRSTTRRR